MVGRELDNAICASCPGSGKICLHDDRTTELLRARGDIERVESLDDDAPLLSIGYEVEVPVSGSMTGVPVIPRIGVITHPTFPVAQA